MQASAAELRYGLQTQSVLSLTPRGDLKHVLRDDLEGADGAQVTEVDLYEQALHKQSGHSHFALQMTLLI